ncbi:MAG: rhomboid family intramembrane serine protease [Ardenticatenaceae bacterium]|nr:rhomboid family intramembrane serine protease [Ardenticatenaceae bacterium]HBY92573.1 rhomboid family intramembrane serine protease [Chloroflexota bacterium]
MFPIGDEEVRGAGPPWVTWGLIAINSLVFLYEASLSQQALQDFIFRYGLVPANITQGVGLGTILTSMFLHGGWLHLIGNMLFLWVFGDNVEAIMGHVLYLGFYLLGGLAAEAAHMLFNLGSDIPSVGASGAIAAVLGAYIVMFPNSQVRVLVFLGYRAGVTRVTALVFLGIWAITQLFNGIASLGVPTSQTSGVAVWAHVGGFAFGLLAGFLFRGRVSQVRYETRGT